MGSWEYNDKLDLSTFLKITNRKDKSFKINIIQDIKSQEIRINQYKVY